MNLNKLIDGLKAHKSGAASYESVDEAIRVLEAMRDVDGEKVCKGLECCVLRDPDDHRRCGECPYNPHAISNEPCANGLKYNALSLIRQQQARIAELEAEHEAKVITLDGLSNYRGPVWMLKKTSSGMVGHWQKPFSGFDTGIYACFEEECFLVEEYGKTWIPWTKKPTNERIKAVKWNG